MQIDTEMLYWCHKARDQNNESADFLDVDQTETFIKGTRVVFELQLVL